MVLELKNFGEENANHMQLGQKAGEIYSMSHTEVITFCLLLAWFSFECTK